jgi:hypothetical protein
MWDNEMIPAMIKASSTRIYYQGKHFNNFEPVDYIYYGAFSSITGSRNGDGMSDVINDGSEIRIYPNPATDEINIALPAFSEDNVTLTIRNANGAVVIEQNVSAGMSNFKMDTSHLQPGMYIMECNGVADRMMKKFIITER